MVSTRTAAQVVRPAASTGGAAVARVGLVARGVIYLLIGWIALMLATGRSNAEADQRGALQTLAGQPAGGAMLWALAVGFAAYALWRFSEAIRGVHGEGKKAGPRVTSAFRGVVYAFFAVTTVSVLHGSRSSQAGTQQDATAKIMRHSGGRWAIGILGACVVIVGLGLAIGGLRRTFAKKLNTGQMSERTRRTVLMLGANWHDRAWHRVRARRRPRRRSRTELRSGESARAR